MIFRDYIDNDKIVMITDYGLQRILENWIDNDEIGKLEKHTMTQ
jgi:hypothetical protein